MNLLFAIFSEPIWIWHRIRDIVQMLGEIVLLTDDPALIYVGIDENRLRDDSKMRKSVEFAPALAQCLTCHHFGETNRSHLAPTLANIMNKRIANYSFQRYSDGLKKKPGVWDKDSLTRFISSPNEFAPGSGMPRLGLSDAQIKEVVSALGAKRLHWQFVELESVQQSSRCCTPQASHCEVRTDGYSQRPKFRDRLWPSNQE